MSDKPKLRLLSLGAGVQSTTLALMAANGEWPNEPLDGAIFADTGWEPEPVYKHLEWLKSVLPFHVHITSNGNIRTNIVTGMNTTGGRFASVPWFVTNPDGSAGMGRRQCSSEYKLTPIMWKSRELLGKSRRDYVPKGSIECWIGISKDESSRMKDARQKYLKNRWPLIERGMTRADCLAWLKANGYPEPPKSACIGCPFHNAAMWREMRDERPQEFADAVEVDRHLRGRDGGPASDSRYARGFKGTEFMHVLRVPLDEAVDLQSTLNDQQPNLFENECEGICGV